MTYDKENPDDKQSPETALSVTLESPSPNPAETGRDNPKPIDIQGDVPLHIGDVLPGLRGAMDAARMAYHRGDDGQDILHAQAEALDALFVRVMNMATHATDRNGKMVENYLNSDYLDFALRTQRHCRKTIESLTVIREHERRQLAEKRAERLKHVSKS